MLFSTILIPVLAATVAAQEYSILPHPVQPKCTSTLTELPGCCPPIAAHTATSYVDCNGCDLEITTQGVQCLMACAPTTTTDFSSTTTVKKCAASSTPSITTSACTSTITSWKPPCGGCMHTAYATTETARIDCGGCALETFTTKINAGVCIQCVQGPQTTTKSEATTVTACAVSASATY